MYWRQGNLDTCVYCSQGNLDTQKYCRHGKIDTLGILTFRCSFEMSIWWGRFCIIFSDPEKKISPGSGSDTSLPACSNRSETSTIGGDSYAGTRDSYAGCDANSERGGEEKYPVPGTTMTKVLSLFWNNEELASFTLNPRGIPADSSPWACWCFNPTTIGFLNSMPRCPAAWEVFFSRESTFYMGHWILKANSLRVRGVGWRELGFSNFYPQKNARLWDLRAWPTN